MEQGRTRIVLIGIMLSVAYFGVCYGLVTKVLGLRAKLESTQEDIATLKKEAYDQGFNKGVESVNISKSCVDWWFTTDNKDRHKQAQKAYCKGNK